jgi:prepilin-type N-terminal cleavage/methylation domain-containing protein
MKLGTRRHRRAFTIPELLFALGILGVFALTATQLFYATMRVSRNSAEHMDAAASFDSAVAALRADAWSAGEIATPNDNIAKLGNITWTISGTTLMRDADNGVDGGATPRRWEVPPGGTFTAEPAAVVFHVPRTKSERGGDVRMVSQPLVLEKLKS